MLDILISLITYIIYSLLLYYIIIITLYLPYYYLTHKRDLKHKKLMIVFGSGGHTTEMLLMLKKFEFDKYQHVYFVIGHTDTWSLTKIQDFFRKSKGIDVLHDLKNLTILRLFRSREVK